MKIQEMFRHGDVQLIRVAEIPAGAQLCKDRKVLADGEVTGHAHRVDLGELFRTEDGKLYLRVEKLTKAKLTHEEHKTITLDPGCYLVGQKRQYTPDGWETVHD